MTEHGMGWPSTDEEVLVEQLPGSDQPAHYFLAETLDGLYTPYALRLPEGPGPHPFVLIAYGNGGGGMSWLRDRVHRFRYVTDLLLDAGYASAWSRYRTEVELGYQTGGALHSDIRQGMPLLNRAPLEYEDEVAILSHAAEHQPSTPATCSTSASVTPARCSSSCARSTTGCSAPGWRRNPPRTSS